jgi:hypothetical protein
LAANLGAQHREKFLLELDGQSRLGPRKEDAGKTTATCHQNWRSRSEQTRRIIPELSNGTDFHVVTLVTIIARGEVAVSLGLALGLAGAFAVARLLRSLLFEVKPTDPATYAGVAALLAVVALAASYLPARRATRVDPVTAPRQE